ncbi:MAG TPA: DUF2085 domain-containing protein [Anaerolineae bacterium]|nr:DUF2085 domain-containing protein [Anaerolineae bacterium]
MVTQSPASPATRKVIRTIDGIALFVVRHWLALFLIIYGAWVWLPFLAPIFMHIGATGPADALYFMYSFFCHQLPERSIFFFGPQSMYSLDQIGKVWSTENQLVLRQFIGTPEMGWKMAWSDRMISTYGGVWLGALLWALMGGTRAPRVSLVLWVLLGVLPLGLDGFTHFLNDIVAGSSGQGFRDTNDWLRMLTANAFPDSFYYGNMFGSFNSWARWITGLLFGITTVFAIFPIVALALEDTRHDLEYQLARIRAVEGH